MPDVKEPVLETAAVSSREAPDPALVRTVLVQILKDCEQGLTVAELQKELVERVKARFQPRVQVDLENLTSLGIIEASPSDERKFIATRLADVYLRGAETLSHG